MVRDLINTGKYTLINGTKKCKGGVNTRIDPSDSRKGSCLDLFIVSQELEKYIDKLEIDEKRIFSPFFVNDKFEKKYSDHLACILSFKNIPLKSKTVSIPKEIKWNTKQPEGWTKYFLQTNCNNKLNDIANCSLWENVDDIEQAIEKVATQQHHCTMVLLNTVNGSFEHHEWFC